MRTLTPVLAGAAVALAVAGAATLHRVTGSTDRIESLERLSLDARFRLRGERPAGPELALVAIDDRSAEGDQGLLERREGMARLIRAAHQAGARVIGIDAFFLEPERFVDPALAQEVSAFVARCREGCAGTEAASLLARVERELSGDSVLAEAIREAGNVVLALHVGTSRGRMAEAGGLSRGRFGQVVDGPLRAPSSEEVMASLGPFNAAARGLGFVSVFEDGTSSIRSVSAGRTVEGGTYVPFGLQLVAAYQGVGRGRLVFDGAGRRVSVGDRSVAFEPDGGIFLNWRGKSPFPVHSALDLVQGRVPPGALSDRLVVIGYTHLGQDRVRTSFDVQTPGFQVAATVADNLLRQDPLRRAPWWWDALATLVVGLLVAGLFWPRLLRRPALQVLAALALFAAWLVASHLAFSRGDLWLSWVWPAAAFAGVLLTSLAGAYAVEGRQRRELRRAFTHYLAEEVVRELEQGDPVRLGGERRVLTALFSDIRGFTTLSEQLDPQALLRFLNTHLGAMTRAVQAQGGLLDKYIGDALMAFFGAPVLHVDHAARAVAAVLAMHRELEALNAGPFRALGLTVRIGVGLNTGEMVVGNMGSENRVNYTIAGDAVNLASRLEGLTKAYGVFCLVGEATRRAAGEAFTFREVDLVQVKGKQQAVAIHELVAGPGRTVATYREPELFAASVLAWRAGDFGRAREGFTRFAAQNPHDAVAPLYLERLAALGDEAPPGWTGVYVHHSK